MLEEGAIINNVSTAKDNWRVSLFVKLTDMWKNNELDFIPLIQAYDKYNHDHSKTYPPLANMLEEIDENALPQIFFSDPVQESVPPYPEKLDDASKFSPELIAAWASKVVVENSILDFMVKVEQEADSNFVIMDVDDDVGDEREVFSESEKR